MTTYQISDAFPFSSPTDDAETIFGKDPAGTFSPGGERLRTLDGLESYNGFERATWTFSAITLTQWAAVIDIIGGFSGVVYIRTHNDEDTYASYEAIATMPNPDELERWGSRFIDVEIRFILLGAAS